MRDSVVRTKSGLVIPRSPTVSVLKPEQMELVEAAYKALRTDAFNPVEHILVGAAIRMQDEEAEIFIGGNLRGTDAYRHMHAEEVALVAAEKAGYVKGVSSVATIANQDGPKPPCDDCSKMLLARASRYNVDTEIILSNNSMSEFSVIKVSQMFAYRNIPLGIELEPETK